MKPKAVFWGLRASVVPRLELLVPCSIDDEAGSWAGPEPPHRRSVRSLIWCCHLHLAAVVILEHYIPNFGGTPASARNQSEPGRVSIGAATIDSVARHYMSMGFRFDAMSSGGIPGFQIFPAVKPHTSPYPRPPGRMVSCGPAVLQPCSPMVLWSCGPIVIYRPRAVGCNQFLGSPDDVYP